MDEWILGENTTLLLTLGSNDGVTCFIYLLGDIVEDSIHWACRSSRPWGEDPTLVLLFNDSNVCGCHYPS